MPEDQKTADKQHQSQHTRPTTPFSYQAPANETDQSTKDKYGPHREWIRFAVEFLAFLVLICYANSASIQAVANRRAANAAATSAHAAASQAVTAAKQLELSERPWVKVTNRIIEGPIFDAPAWKGPVARVVIEDTLENVGQTVATDVLSWEDGIPVETVNGLPNIRNAIARQNQWCGDNRHTPNGGMTGYVLFPRDPFVERSTVGPPMDAVMKVASESPVGLKGMVSFVMVGCVSYHAPFEPKNAEKHETRFIYWLGKMRPDGMFPYVQPKGVVTTLQLVIFPNGLSAD